MWNAGEPKYDGHLSGIVLEDSSSAPTPGTRCLPMGNAGTWAGYLGWHPCVLGLRACCRGASLEDRRLSTLRSGRKRVYCRESHPSNSLGLATGRLATPKLLGTANQFAHRLKSIGCGCSRKWNVDKWSGTATPNDLAADWIEGLLNLDEDTRRDELVDVAWQEPSSEDT